MFLVAFKCAHCGRPNDRGAYALCLRGWEIFGATGMKHTVGANACGADGMDRDQCMTILRVIGGPR